ncbi:MULTISPECIES: calcium-binding protein [unclassified Haematospirillum]|uniref:calcium-binding protein n=1 Tax=unclassified Haematospirillum TaxID=2622088 RepID=UPI001FD786A9|nr:MULTISPECIES: calcium-binding protein [unclassified Haematospirillum]
MFGKAGDDMIFGGEGHDHITGDDGDDVLNGEDGNDGISGGPGADILTGGPGADYFFYGSAQNTIGDIITDFLGLQDTVPDKERDTISLARTGAYIFSYHTPLPYAVWYQKEGTSLVIIGDTDGNPTNTEIRLTLENKSAIYAGDLDMSATFLYGLLDLTHQSGLQKLDLSDPSYKDVTCVLGSMYALNEIKGHGGGQKLVGGYYIDWLMGGDGGNNILNGRGGDDTLYGGAGEHDKAIYTYETRNIAVTLEEPYFLASVYLNGAFEGMLRDIEDIDSGSGDDHLIGNTRDNCLRGNDGNDTLEGREGNDDLDGGPGRDSMTGGPGADRFRFSGMATDSVDDLVTDFNASEGDRIHIATSIDANATKDGVQAFTFAGTTASPHSLWIHHTTPDGGGGIQLQGDTDGNADTHEFRVSLPGIQTFDPTTLIIEDLM